MTVTISNELLANITLPEQDPGGHRHRPLQARTGIAGRAAEISGLPSPEFLNELGRRRIPINYEAEDLRLDRDTLKH